MKKLYIPVFFILVFTGAYGFNIDGGGTVDSFAGSSLKEDSTFFGYEKLSLYTSMKFSKNASFAADAFYKFSYKVNDDEFNHIVDINTLLFTSSLELGGSKVSYQLGRGFKSDYAGDILAHNLDGISLVVPFSFATLYIHGGYTGLIHTDELSLITTQQDRLDEPAEDLDKNFTRDNVRLLIEGMDLVKETDYLTIWGSIYSYQDMRPENSGKNLALYAGGGVRGPITTSIYYNVRGNYKTGTFSYSEQGSEDDLETALINAGMGVAAIDWFPTSGKLKELNTMASLKVGVSSGDGEILNSEIGSTQGKELDGVTLYSPIISSGPGNIYSTPNSNLSYGGLKASVSPIRNLQFVLGGTSFFRTVEGVTGDSGVSKKSSGNYLGTEVYITGNYRILSDLGLSINGGVNIPNKDITGEEISGLVSAYLSLSL